MIGTGTDTTHECATFLAYSHRVPSNERKSSPIRKALLVTALALATMRTANAAGCLKGGVIGGVAGHYAGHHAVVDASVASRSALSPLMG